MTPSTGMLFSLEGIDGSGKSLQRVMAGSDIRKLFPAIEIVETWEPGYTDIGSRIRQLILEKHKFREGDPSPLALALMILADRAEHVAKIVAPALSRGAIVITDRFADSTICYQGYGAGIDLSMLQIVINEIMRVNGLHNSDYPFTTIYFDIDPYIAKSRIRKNERWDDASGDFRRRVFDGYRNMVTANSHRVVAIDAGKTVLEVKQQIVDIIAPRVEAHYGVSRRVF